VPVRSRSRDVSLLAVVRALAVLVGVTFCVPTESLAQPSLQSDDIGDAGVTGFAPQQGGVWTVGGAGADVWGNADGAHFVHQASTDSVNIIARVDDMQDTNPFAKAGVMVRQSMRPGIHSPRPG
jgi:hypothetical protein